MSDWLGAPTLIGTRVMLRPLTLDDASELGAVADDPEVYRWTRVPTDTASATTTIQTALDTPDRTAFAVIDNADGSIVGSTSFYDIRAADRSLAIGHTFYAVHVLGTTVNPDAKLLLLQHAFERCAAVRVVWHTDELNARSRAGIAKLGTTFEGLLRKQKRSTVHDGWRTTAQYSMTDDDWPVAKARLIERVRGV
ncbi:GNAT family N-acetyltransferase [Williamsia sterculiae]|uniref:Protein N-acetyltransferase, RimJ/RimL family n=1 Tax=Williamsia sterculiae TaxID=1344003 RepID=A0A1N7FID5_9NOCA|nr:GNAT family protein [Williamsia sterculiae]SIS00057.1 Protein N-acetyltransferase, RimJ/RimL family [Williamsia sterculiae]